MNIVPLLKKISGTIYLLQCVWKEEPFRGTGRMTLSPGKDEDVRWKLTPHSPSNWFETTFPSKCWHSFWDVQSLGGRKDRHCKVVNSCMAGGTLKLDYTQGHSFPAPKSVGGSRSVLTSLCCVSWRAPEVGIDTQWVECTDIHIAAAATWELKGFLSALGPGSLTFFVSSVFSFFQNARILTFNAAWFAYNYVIRYGNFCFVVLHIISIVVIVFWDLPFMP